jgi:hypothetical protein
MTLPITGETAHEVEDFIERFSAGVRAARRSFDGHRDPVRFRDELADLHRSSAEELVRLVAREAERVGRMRFGS